MRRSPVSKTEKTKPEKPMFTESRIGLSQCQGRDLSYVLLRMLGAIPLVFLAQYAKGDDTSAAAGQVVGRSSNQSGLLLCRPGPGEAWQIVPLKGSLNSGDLLVGIPSAQLDSENGALRLAFLGNLDGLSPFPVIE